MSAIEHNRQNTALQADKGVPRGRYTSCNISQLASMSPATNHTIFMAPKQFQVAANENGRSVLLAKGKWTTCDFCCPPSVAGALQASRSDESRSPRIRRTTYALYKAMTQTDGFRYLLRSQGKLVIRNHLLSQSTPRLQCVLLQYFKHSRFHLQEEWQISTPVKGNNETIQRRI